MSSESKPGDAIFYIATVVTLFTYFLGLALEWRHPMAWGVSAGFGSWLVMLAVAAYVLLPDARKGKGKRKS